MEPLEFVFGLIFLGSVTAIARRLIDACAGGGKHKAAELHATQDHARTLEAQLVDARRQNEQLQRQLEWDAKMLETQDRLVKQLTGASVRTPVGSPG
jgi:hypothetical protein